jgi:2-hydroxycyclohexanecarboxyl-CoA dehydrogenase
MDGTGRVAVVTGGASGIGLAIVQALASASITTILTDIDEAAGSGPVSDSTHVSFRNMDVTSDDSTSRVAAEILSTFGRVDILVNCAGGSIPRPFLETTSADWSETIELNLLGTLRCTHTFLPAMADKGFGRVINIASDAGKVGQLGQAAYSASKGGVIAFTKTIAREFATAGITSNAVCPGATRTPAMENFLRGGEANRAFVEEIERRVPVGRLAEPVDVASAVTFLASDAAAYITGQAISVSGGATLC